MTNKKQLNMQMPDAGYVSKRTYNPLEHMNLMDDFLFDVATVETEGYGWIFTWKILREECSM